MPTLHSETWLPVPGFSGYEVSDLGNVRSVDRWIERVDGRRYFYAGKLLTGTANGRDGYRYVQTGLQGGFFVAIAVCTAFRGSPGPGEQVRHLDGNNQNNRLDNLLWGTASENNYDRVRHGTHNHARKTHCPAGHEYTPENISSHQGRRHCRECHRLREKSRRQKLRTQEER